MRTLPDKFEISQNYPNPFNPVTNIQYQLPEACKVEIKIYNMIGQEIKTLVSEQKAAGYYHILWNGTDNYGYLVSSCIYFYIFTAGDYNKTNKMVLLK